MKKTGLLNAALRALAAIAIALGLLAPAGAADDFLPPQQAYKYTTRIESARLIVSWNIEKGYYLYRNRMGVALANTSAASSEQTPSDHAGVQLGEAAWPKGESHTDEYFGEQEIYRGKFDVPVPITFQAKRPASLSIELKL